MAVKIRQGQVWIHGTEFIRVVRSDRLEVAFKIFMKLGSDEGQHHRASKKEFCRLVKNCTLLSLPMGGTGSAATSSGA